jgi:undecaprenyl-diphosphatase
VDPRPFTQGVHPLFPHAADNGFPSEHALFSFTLAFLSFSVSRLVAYGLLPLAMIVGACRVLAGVHHTVDIIAGAVLAAAAVAPGVWLANVNPFVKLWRPRNA